MNFNKKHQRQLLNELSLIIDQPKFQNISKEKLKYLNIFRHKVLEDLLKDKRRTYNLEYIKLFDRYQIFHTDLHTYMDEIWTSIEVKPIHKQFLSDLSVILFGRSTSVSFDITFDVIAAKWCNYLSETKRYATKYTNKLIST